MPKQLTRDIYICVHCKKEFTDEEIAKNHEIFEHDIIYLPVERKDLNALLNFIVSNENNKQLLSERLLNTLFQFTRVK